jgi:hypothetical protein
MGEVGNYKFLAQQSLERDSRDLSEGAAYLRI